MISIEGKGICGSYDAYWENGVCIGEFLVGDDGYYAYWPAQRAGYITAYFMRGVADKLDELNEDWDQTVRSDLNK